MHSITAGPPSGPPPGGPPLRGGSAPLPNIPSPVQFTDLSSVPSLGAVLALLREVTGASSSTASIASFASRYRQVRPVDAFVGVRPAPETPGGYRVVFANVEGTDILLRPESAGAMAALPVHSNGLVSMLIADPTPKMASNFSFVGDSALAGLPADLVTCMALPLFSGETVEEWVITFSRKGHETFNGEDVSRALMTGNLLALANRHLDSYSIISRLNASLRDQFDQVARVQQQLLPARTPDIPSLEIATSYLPSEMAGGDYYDFFRLPGGAWGILIADVSGHGAAAATIMAMLHAILHAYAPISDGSGDRPPNPAEVLEFANTRLAEANLEGAFVTAIFAVYLPALGLLTFANAGHPPPRLKRGTDGALLSLESDASIPLGVLQPLGALPTTVNLHPNDTVVLYTDGITEAFSPRGEMFGLGRMDEALTGCTGQPDCVVESVHRALFEHRGNATRDDDQTLVALRYKPVV